MIRDLNKIFELWKDKVGSKRTPNPKNAEHQYQLREILNQFNWDEEVITELLYNLTEEEKEEKPNIWQTKQGNWRGERPDGTRRSYKDKNKTVRWVGGEEDPGDDKKTTKKPNIPKKPTLNKKERERKARLEQDTKDINFDEEGKPRKPKQRREKAKEKAERRRKEIYLGKDFPAGTPGSTTGEMGGGMAAEDIGDPDKPNFTEEEWVDQELKEINKADGEVKGKGSLRKKICGNKKGKVCDEAIREWLEVAYRTGLNELNQLKNNKDYKAKKPQPDGLPTGHIMDYHGKEMVVNEMKQRRDAAPEGSKERAHYDQQLRYLGVPPGNPDEKPETDTGMLYMDDGDPGKLRFKHTSNKKSESDPHFNKSIASRQKSMGESADRQLKECELLKDKGRQREDCVVRVEAARKDIKKATASASRAVSKGDRVVGSDVRDITGREGGKEDLMKGSSLLSKLPGRSELQGSDYSDKVRKKKPGYSALHGECERMFGKQPPKWKDAQIMEANVFLLENGEPTSIKDAKQMEGKEEGKVVRLENGKYARMVNGEPRYCDKKGDPEFGPGTGKLLYKMSEMIDTMRTKNSKLKPPLTPESSDEELEELGAEYKPKLSADEMKWILFSESATGLRDTNDKRKAIMDKAHAKIVKGVQDSDAKLDGFASKPPPDGPVTDEKGDNGPATQQYVDSYMEDMHWNKYIDGDTDGVGDMSIDGKNVEPKHFRECLAKLSGVDKKVAKNLESKNPKKREAARKALKEHLSKKLRISAKTERGKTGRVTKESHEAHISFDSETDEVLRGKKTGRKRKVSVGEETYRSKGVGVNSVLGGLGADMQDCIREKMDGKDNKQ
jgi:hypothetical protein